MAIVEVPGHVDSDSPSVWPVGAELFTKSRHHCVCVPSKRLCKTKATRWVGCM